VPHIDSKKTVSRFEPAPISSNRESNSSGRARKSVHVRGIVQGVGFRPWVYSLAKKRGLAGFVLNSSAGVSLEIEGSTAALDRFLEEFSAHPPGLAQIDEIRIEDSPPTGAEDFVIRESAESEEEFVLAPPDIATCPDCIDDFSDPANRRHHYPFTNCTQCGPRYTIIRDIPYDRPFTTMAEFSMCPACQAEYDDPADRRFHAQPNSCPNCGPRLELWDKSAAIARGPEALPRVREFLRRGRIIAIKGLGGFHLACDATNDTAVRLLRERKRRSGKPFALMARDTKVIERLATIGEAERRLLEGPRRPIVILEGKEGGGLSDAIAPGNSTVGMMLPYTPLHHLLFQTDRAGEAPLDVLVMTSGNLSEEPIVSRNEEVPSRLHSLADYFLLHDRRIQTRVDDSVVRAFESRERVLRRARGYAPLPIDLGRPLRQLLALGGELKNTFCLTKSHYAILSQHIGDLENLETKMAFEQTLEHVKRFFRVEWEAVAHDLHPGYLTTQMAQAMKRVETIPVQHHHAHTASCMAENRLDGMVIGVALDGTGYGTDSKIWGGEFLVADYRGFERRAHLRYVPLPGGDAAIRQPWRMGLSYLIDVFGEAAGSLAVPLNEQVPESRRTAMARIVERRVNCIETSSCGRLFDAVAAILGVRQEITFEGQAAIELEMFARQGPRPTASYPFDFASDGSIDLRPLIKALVGESCSGASARAVAARFHYTLAAIIVEACRRIRSSDGLNRVCLSGGTFQNFTLLEETIARLRQNDFEVFLHSKVPPNDGGLSLGQAMVANARLS
jgi:hydrogenase maturation protein HypF